MPTLDQLVASLVQWQNEVVANSKKNEELPALAVLNKNGLMRISIAGNSYTITPQQIIDGVVINNEGGIQNGIIKGGIQHITGLTYNVWVTAFAINGVRYDISRSQLITLSDGDGSNPRFDVIAVQVPDPITQIVSFVIIEGTPAVSPTKPTVNLETQAELTFRLVDTGETVDPNAVKELIYDENLGEPNEWDNTFLLEDGNLNVTGTPSDPSFQGTKFIRAIDGTNPIDPRIVFDKDSTIEYNPEEKFGFALRTSGLGSWDYYSYIRIRLINSTSGVYYTITLNRNNILNYGFFHDVDTFQVVAIPLSDFYSGNIGAFQYDRIEFKFELLQYVDLDWINILGGDPEVVEELPLYEEDIIGRRYKGTGISGTFKMDWKRYSLFILTLTGATAISHVNIPTGEFTSRKTAYITGGSFSLPADHVGDPDNDTYSATKWNRIEFECIDGGTVAAKVRYTLKNLENA